ncbi:MAG: BMP family ABC transporter substrate-binding protein, partial [Anaerobacillus sp.]
MKKKYGFMLSAVLAAGTLLSACGTNDSNNESSGGGSSEGKSSDFKVAMVTDTGGVDDKSFNQSAWEGLQQFGKDNGLEEDKGFKYVQSTAASDYQPNLSGLIREDYDLVFGIGFLMQQDIQTIAAQKPDAQLALVDSVAVNEDGDPVENVASITFKEHQGSFLVGVIAGMQSETNKVGFIGGVDSELIKKFESGFKAGVKSVNPDAEIF